MNLGEGGCSYVIFFKENEESTNDYVNLTQVPSRCFNLYKQTVAHILLMVQPKKKYSPYNVIGGWNAKHDLGYQGAICNSIRFLGT